MPGFDPLSPEPIIAGEHHSEYTHGEIHALLAPVLGMAAEDIKSILIITDLGDRFAFGGTAGMEDGKELLVRAVMSGVLNYSEPS